MGGEGNLEFSLMSILVFLILASLALAVSALGGFIWAVRTGQFEDTCTPTMRVLMEDPEGTTKSAKPGIVAADVRRRTSSNSSSCPPPAKKSKL
jgi:cbb3-type cytochrome oxidase maturation protein